MDEEKTTEGQRKDLLVFHPATRLGIDLHEIPGRVLEWQRALFERINNDDNEHFPRKAEETSTGHRAQEAAGELYGSLYNKIDSWEDYEEGKPRCKSDHVDHSLA